MCGADFSATEGGVLHGKHSSEVHVRAHTAKTCEATRVYFFRLHGGGDIHTTLYLRARITQVEEDTFTLVLVSLEVNVHHNHYNHYLCARYNQ